MQDNIFFLRVCSIVENALQIGKRKFVLYPYGYNGMKAEQILRRRYGIPDLLLIDNNLASYSPRVSLMSDLKKADFPEEAILIFTLENPTVFKQVYQAIPDFIPRDAVIFIFEEIAKENKGKGASEDFLYRKCLVGRHTTGYEYIVSRPGLCKSIGRFCAINGSARIVSNHPLDMVSVSSSFYTPPHADSPAELDGADDNLFAQRLLCCQKYGRFSYNKDFNVPLGSYVAKNEPCVIGNDVWIGHNVPIMPGLNIGDGAVLAANCVVTHDVNPYTIVAGVPARPIRKRFSEEDIEKFLRIKWWEWTDEKIKENYELFYQPKAFLQHFA